jgi:hypothetical protein
MPTTDEEVAALKEATREAHEAMKDLNMLIQLAKATVKELNAAVSEALEEGIGKQVQEGLDAYKDSLGNAIDTATESIYKRFDMIADLLLGEDKQSKRAGKASIAELVEKKVRVENAHKQ